MMMNGVPLLRKAAFQQCTSAMTELGLNTDRELSRAGIAMWHYGAPNDWVPLQVFLDTLLAGATKLGDPHFGITVAALNPMRFGAIGQAITRSATLYTALQVSARLVNKLNTSAKIWLSDGPDTIWFCRSPTHNTFLEQFVLGHMIALVQMAAGDRWMPRDVRLSAKDDAGLNRIAVLDDASIRTDQSCLAIAVPKALVVDEIHAGLQAEELSSLEDRTQISAPPEDFTGSLRQIIESSLIDRCPSIEMICEILGVPKRTLQRELAREGLTFRGLVAQARYRKACQFLVETDMSNLEIANALNYSNDVHFIRAFKSWVGITPGEFRHHSALRAGYPN
jgi:AraC-like DNA-binding protein